MHSKDKKFNMLKKSNIHLNVVGGGEGGGSSSILREMAVNFSETWKVDKPPISDA